MSSNTTSDWWRGEADWETPAGLLLRRFFATLPAEGCFRLVLQGSALRRELWPADLEVRREIIAPAIARRRVGYGETPPDYKRVLREN